MRGSLARAALVAASIASAGCRRDAGPANERGGATNPTGTASPSRPARRPANAAELALVAPLAPGSRLADYEVVRIEGVERGALRVVCAKEQAVVRLDVALAADDGPPPPATAGRYAIFWNAHDAPLDEAERLAKALAEVVKKNAGAPVPEGLGPFTPRAVPQTL
jgi:hypothetical protein